MKNKDLGKVTLTIKDCDSETSITRNALNLTDMLELISDALKGQGFEFTGRLIIEEYDNELS